MGPLAGHLTLGSDRVVGRHSRYQYSVILSAQSGAVTVRDIVG